MLPAGSRLRHRADFATVTRSRGVRGHGLLVVHGVLGAPDRAGSGATASRAGFVVPRSVGPAVTRNRVKRRLRHLVAPRLARLPRGSSVVVRALPGSATASSATLGGALDEAVARLLRSRP